MRGAQLGPSRPLAVLPVRLSLCHFSLRAEAPISTEVPVEASGMMGICPDDLTFLSSPDTMCPC